MTNTAKLPALFTTIILALLGLTITVGSLAPTTAAAAPVCTTDLDCAAWELGQAAASGERIHEDLSFAGASELYSAKTDLLADAFWAAHAGEDRQDVKGYVGQWVNAYRSA